MKSRTAGRRVSRVMVLLAATSIMVAACGSDDIASDATSAATEPAADNTDRDGASVHRTCGDRRARNELVDRQRPRRER